MIMNANYSGSAHGHGIADVEVGTGSGFTPEGQDWGEYHKGGLRAVTIIPMTLTMGVAQELVDKPMELPCTSHPGREMLLLSRHGHGHATWVQRSNRLVVAGVQLVGRPLREARRDSWHVNLEEDTGRSLSVVWIAGPAGPQLVVVDGAVRWVRGERPRLRGLWKPEASQTVLELGAWQVLGHVLPSGCSDEHLCEMGDDRGQPVPLLRLPAGEVPLEVIPIEWLSRLVVLARIRGSVANVCAVLEPTHYFLMAPKAAATFSQKVVRGHSGRRKVMEICS